MSIFGLKVSQRSPKNFSTMRKVAPESFQGTLETNSRNLRLDMIHVRK